MFLKLAEIPFDMKSVHNMLNNAKIFHNYL
jgi:hypothetical protein